MRTCFNCANSIDPKSDHGRRHQKKVTIHGEYHPLSHFAICGRRNVWLETARVNCGNWGEQVVHELELASGRTRKMVRGLISRNRYRVAAAAYTALLAVAIMATAILQG